MSSVYDEILDCGQFAAIGEPTCRKLSRISGTHYQLLLRRSVPGGRLHCCRVSMVARGMMA
jgi:hypothetical protein